MFSFPLTKEGMGFLFKRLGMPNSVPITEGQIRFEPQRSEIVLACRGSDFRILKQGGKISAARRQTDASEFTPDRKLTRTISSGKHHVDVIKLFDALEQERPADPEVLAISVSLNLPYIRTVMALSDGAATCFEDILTNPASSDVLHFWQTLCHLYRDNRFEYFIPHEWIEQGIEKIAGQLALSLDEGKADSYRYSDIVNHLFLRMATSYLASGQEDRCRELVTKARKFATEHDCFSPLVFSRMYLNMGDLDMAMTIDATDTTNEPPDHAFFVGLEKARGHEAAMEYLLERFEKAGQRIAEHRRSAFLTRWGKFFGEYGESERAKFCFEAALAKMANTDLDEMGQTQKLAPVANEYLLMDDPSRACVIVESMKYAQIREESYLAVARWYIDHEDYSKAAQMIDRAKESLTEAFSWLFSNENESTPGLIQLSSEELLRATPDDPIGQQMMLSHMTEILSLEAAVSYCRGEKDLFGRYMALALECAEKGSAGPYEKPYLDIVDALLLIEKAMISRTANAMVLDSGGWFEQNLHRWVPDKILTDKNFEYQLAKRLLKAKKISEAKSLAQKIKDQHVAGIQDRVAAKDVFELLMLSGEKETAFDFLMHLATNLDDIRMRSPIANPVLDILETLYEDHLQNRT